jgi:hypothetical protein
LTFYCFISKFTFIEEDRLQIASALKNLENNQHEMMAFQKEFKMNMEQAMYSIKKQIKKLNVPEVTAQSEVRVYRTVYISNPRRKALH